MSVEGIRFEERGHTLWCTIDRPEKRNAMTTEMYDSLGTRLSEFDRNPDLRVAVLTGEGADAFCSGSDIHERIGELVGTDWDSLERDPFARFFSRIGKPIVAAVNGYCIGGGTEMLLGTDIRIAVDTAWFSLPEVQIGVIPVGGSHIRLPKQIPYAMAMEMLLTGGRLSAHRAYEIGLVNAVVPADDFESTVQQYVDRIAANAPVAVQTAKSIAIAGLDLEHGFHLDHLMAGKVFASDDALEGRSAFLEKRKAEFRGR